MEALEEDEEDYMLQEYLTSIAIIGRRDIGSSLELLNNIFISKMANLQSNLEKNISEMDDLWDDIEWILDIAGFVLADVAEGESRMIPDEVRFKNKY
jgi:hypothetical protein